jgi:hypothetical protein
MAIGWERKVRWTVVSVRKILKDLSLPPINTEKMSMKMVLKYTVAWIPMVFIAIANGVLRQYVYGRRMKELSAHQVSSLTAAVLFYFYTSILGKMWPLESSHQALAVGIIWLCLTVAFEFLFGHYVANHPWSRLIQDYNLLSGRLWALVLLAVAAAPYVVYKLNY